MAYPSKPWTDGQVATGIVEGETYIYDASQSVWVHQTKATLDSDYQVDKAEIQADISGNTSAIVITNARIDADSDRATAIEASVTTLEGRVDTLDLLSDSEAERVQGAIDTINTALSMLDSDGIALQSIRTDFEAADAAIIAKQAADSDRMTSIEQSIADNSALDAVTNADHDSDVAVLQSNIDAVVEAVVSYTQPAGVSNQLWVNLNDGKLYYWNDSDAFVSIVTA